MISDIFWNVTLCKFSISLAKFRKTVQPRLLSQKLNKQYAYFLLDLLLNPEDGISMFLRKVDKRLPKYIQSEHNMGLQVIQRYRYSAQFTVHRCTRTRILSLH
jgi:hypothetical protein